MICNLTYEEYEKCPGINSTIIKAGRLSMKHMQNAALNKGEDTAAKTFGRLVHTAILEPKKYKESVRVWTGGMKRGKDWDGFKADVGDGVTIITADEQQKINEIFSAVFANKVAARMIQDSEHELSLFWDGLYGKAKARIDGYSVNYGVFDLKTTSTINPKQFAAQFINLGYHLQLGWYYIAARECGLELPPMNPMNVIVVETKPPYDCVVFRGLMNVVDQGMHEAEEIAKKYNIAKQINSFPGIGDEVDFITPSWFGCDSKIELDFTESEE